MSMKNSNDTMGNRTRDLPDCSAVPQRNAPPPAPSISKIFKSKMVAVLDRDMLNARPWIVCNWLHCPNDKKGEILNGNSVNSTK